MPADLDLQNIVLKKKGHSILKKTQFFFFTVVNQEIVANLFLVQ